MRGSRGALVLSMAVLVFVTGCVFFKKPGVPMGKELHSGASEKARHLILFLPGLGDGPEDVVEGGLIEEMKRLPQFDSIVADAHFGYYRTGIMTERLHEDIVIHERSKYDEFWIVGTSMGGYGALAYAEKHPNDVTGLILLAPYLGQGKVMSDIEDAGGLAKWKPSGFKTENSRTAHGVGVWAWLKRRPQSPDAPLVFLGIGDDDKLLRGFHLLSPELPPARVQVIPGDHDWPTWRKLFGQVVGSALSAR